MTQLEWKVCTKCSTSKPLSEYYIHETRLDGGIRRRPDCKDCVRARSRARSTPEIESTWHAKRKYGLTLEQANEYWFASACHLCGSPDPKDRRGKFQIDHCHSTGVIRGALCMPCNVGIGNLQDNPDLLRRAADYVERSRCVSPN